MDVAQLLALEERNAFGLRAALEQSVQVPQYEPELNVPELWCDELSDA